VLDKEEKEKIERLGIRAVTTNTIMKRLEDKVRLARLALQEAGR